MAEKNMFSIPSENGTLWWFIAIEHGTLYIVDLPIFHMVIFQFADCKRLLEGRSYSFPLLITIDILTTINITGLTFYRYVY